MVIKLKKIAMDKKITYGLVVAIICVGIALHFFMSNYTQMVRVSNYDEIDEQFVQEANEFFRLITEQVSDTEGKEFPKLADKSHFLYYIKTEDENKVYTNSSYLEIKQLLYTTPYSFYYNSNEGIGEDYYNLDINMRNFLDWFSYEGYLDKYKKVEISFLTNPTYWEDISNEKNNEYVQNYQKSLDYNIFISILLFILACFLVLVLSIFVWLQSKSEETKKINKWYTEIQFLIWTSCMGGYLSIVLEVDFTRFFVIGVIGNIFLIFIGIVMYMSMIRKLQQKTFFSQSICYKVLKQISNKINIIMDKQLTDNLQKIKAHLWILIISLIFEMFVFFFGIALSGDMNILSLFAIFLMILSFVFYYKQTKRLAINIDEDVQKLVEEQMKAERMKIELVTNVSHDLKTPLTSLVSYVDLLAEEPLTDVQKEYVDILQMKTKVLGTIINDLFDLAKVNSDNIEVNLESINLTKLFDQTLAQFDDNFKKSKIKVKTNFIDDAYILADGTRLHRAVANLIDNAIKYALKKTRIYFSLIETADTYICTIQNTANYEMDFSEKEIVERFVRADKARTTDGSGLGLAIAKSFIELSGGKFSITIDGDQFKTTMVFPKNIIND